MDLDEVIYYHLKNVFFINNIHKYRLDIILAIINNH